MLPVNVVIIVRRRLAPRDFYRDLDLQKCEKTEIVFLESLKVLWGTLF